MLILLVIFEAQLYIHVNNMCLTVELKRSLNDKDIKIDKDLVLVWQIRFNPRDFQPLFFGKLLPLFQKVYMIQKLTILILKLCLWVFWFLKDRGMTLSGIE